MGTFRAFGDDTSNVQWGPATNDFLMSIGLKDGVPDVTNGQPCILLVRFKNISKNNVIEVLQLLNREADLTYSFTVLDPSGKDISPDRTGPFGGSAISTELQPGQSTALEFRFSAVCKLSEVGTYVVTAKKEVWTWNGKRFQVFSNPLPVKVVPKDAGS
jgi:hypothetical protein